MMTKICNAALAGKKPTMKDWGFSFMADTELEALRIAYAYRHNPHGVEVKHCPPVDQFMITIFNEKAKAMGINT